MRNLKTAIIAITSISLIGLSANAFAYRGMGKGNYGKGAGPCNYSQLSQEEYQQVQKQREAFFKETEGLRSEIFEKKQALRNELAKESPDTAKASKLQKELSGLQARFDQKRISHVVELKKINPNAGLEFQQGGPRKGKGPGHMGYGPKRGGGYMMSYDDSQSGNNNQ